MPTKLEKPFRSNLLSLGELEGLAGKLSQEHEISRSVPLSGDLLRELQKNHSALKRDYDFLVAIVKKGEKVAQSAEWILDNFHLVHEQIRDILQSFPRSYYQSLPRIATGEFMGRPRVYVLAVTLVSHTDSKIDENVVTRFINTYQNGAKLTIGEIWAINTMYRIVLFENLRRLSARIVADQKEIENANALADTLFAAAGQGPEALLGALEEQTQSLETVTLAFGVAFLRRLREQGPAVERINQWFNESLTRQGTDPNVIVQIQQLEQTTRQQSISNSITSLRLLSGRSYISVFERLSCVDQTLRDDPDGTYPRMSFSSRDHYGKTVERIARKCHAQEIKVAQQAVQLARTAKEANDPQRTRWHAGYYLVDEGRASLEASLGRRRGPLRRLKGLVAARPTFPFLLAVFLATAAILCVYSRYGFDGCPPFGKWILLACAVLPASELSIQILYWLAGWCVPPRRLCSLNLKSGIEPRMRTAVVIPAIYGNTDQVDHLVGQIERHFLSSRRDNIYFGLLGDFTDADEKQTPEDDRLLAYLVRKIDGLNEQYETDENSAFFLFHRERQWNPKQGCWMGWERKRGKLEEFNGYLKTGATRCTVTMAGCVVNLKDIQYVITLDADTILPRGAAHRMIGTLAHPLNHFRLNAEGTRVIQGYGVLQPRMSISVESAGQSLLSSIYAGYAGVDTYTMYVSDAYQDIFGEGNYMGKGIYDVNAFHRVLGGAFPENAILSHDLLEGSYVRCGFISDIELYDSYPALCMSFMARVHRWIRGDWQLLPWLGRKVPGPEGRPRPNPLTLISQWRILDNLRRSLVDPSLLLLIALFLLFPQAHLVLWGLLIALNLAFPLQSHLLEGILSSFRRIKLGAHIRNVFAELHLILKQTGLSLAFLPYQSFLTLDAITKTLFRIFLSKRNLLEWQTATQSDLEGKTTFRWNVGRMGSVAIFTLSLFVLLLVLHPKSLLIASPFIVLWLFSPAIAHWVSKPFAPHARALSEEDRKDLLRLAGKVWKYFEDLALAEDNHLPPDNHQVEPEGMTAHRTSPTNIGLYLLSTVAARDLGFLGEEEMLERIERTIATLERMQRHRGHFYNWYDTRSLEPLMPRYVSTVDSGNLVGFLIALHTVVRRVASRAAPGDVDAENARRTEPLAGRIRALIEGTDFGLLYDRRKLLFHIGFNASSNTLDNSYYDLLASEARLASYVAIALGAVSSKHWFCLNRKSAGIGALRTLLSWNGTMFEYLMPLVVMRNYRNTLLEETCRGALRRQREYGEQLGIPWGVSESAYNIVDSQLNYQYRAFGVPGLGLKPGLSEDIVMAPYATFLSLAVDPKAAVDNLRALVSQGIEGDYGLYESVDYTPERILPGQKRAVVKCFMAHHLGMSLLAIDNALNDNTMRERFHADPRIRSVELLLQERVPKQAVMLDPGIEEIESVDVLRKEKELHELRQYDTPHTDLPEIHMLSNEKYSLVVSNVGCGYSRFEDTALTRWIADPTVESSGTFFYVKDLTTRAYWSSTYRPTLKEPDEFLTTFAPHKVEFYRRDGDIKTWGEITISPGYNVEIRRITLENTGDVARRMEVTSYLEPVLASQGSDVAHPAFSNLFVKTEYLDGKNALLASRRPGAPNDRGLYMFHALITNAAPVGPMQYETDREKFIGRERSLADPVVVDQDRSLSSSTGYVLDPILSLRRQVVLKPGAKARFSFVTGVGHDRGESVRRVEHFQDDMLVTHEMEMAYTKCCEELRFLNLSSMKVHLFQRLASRLVYPSSWRRARSTYIEKNSRGRSGLWALGISGDLPIALVRIRRETEIQLARDAMLAHEYWRANGFRVDMVILNESATGYHQPLADVLKNMIRSGHARELENKPGGIFLRQADTLHEEEVDLLQAAAHVSLVGSSGSMRDQLNLKIVETRPLQPDHVPTRPTQGHAFSSRTVESLDQFNGIGGFAPQTGEYVIVLKDGKQTPAPWINVVSNGRFGFQVSEIGAGYIWSTNSRENKLTTWSNDPVTDPPGEAYYIRDEETGEYWSPTRSPIRGDNLYIVRHGQGYSVFDHESFETKQELLMFVPENDPVKISRIRIKNTADRKRTLSVFYYVRWVLGVNPATDSWQVSTGNDLETGALTARNAYRDDFPERIAFVIAAGSRIVSFTGDRSEFIGRNGSLRHPRGLALSRLSGRLGGGYDPCTAVQVQVQLEPNESKDVCFVVGEGSSIEEVRTLARAYGTPEAIGRSFAKQKEIWRRRLETVQVKTPDRTLDLMLNRWLLYQTLSCRIWSRSAFYQSGGAYGFRDQLQDVMALMISDPKTARDHILRAAARQFEEGDVQHWWHPPQGKGVRTRCSDDFLWLPYVTAEYVTVTGDAGILDEKVSYLQDEPLKEDEMERYGTPRESTCMESLYEHCIRAIERGLAFGVHDLPLIGNGDWNDGMNRLGRKGKGESVWMGWFLYAVLDRFRPLCEARGEKSLSDGYGNAMKKLAVAVESSGWDGAWYRRAFSDAGDIIGSSASKGCRIDAISQSWAVISGAADPERASKCMDAFAEHLVREGDKLVLLLTPPFDSTGVEVGYIQGYPPGIRENGGQYTHAAAWSILALAMMGKGDIAGKLMRLVNPVNRARNEVERYKVEPYVMAGDIYSEIPHTGRGGWTWYTGSSGWIYRTGIEWVLGLKLRGNAFTVDPSIPSDWDRYEIVYRDRDTSYQIEVENPHGVCRGVKAVWVDGVLLKDRWIVRRNDGHVHTVRVILEKA